MRRDAAPGIGGSSAAPFAATFAAALTAGPGTHPPGLRTWNGSNPQARFDVYRNNVVVARIEVLADTFPVVRRLVGPAFFSAMARRFIADHPPRSPVMIDWGDELAAWLERFEPAASLPYLADMARLERARVVAFHAADRAPLAPGELSAAVASPERLARSRLELHPSLKVMRSRWAIVSMWAAHQQTDDDASVEPVEVDRAESALVLRNGDEVLVLPLDDPEAAFVEALQRGATLGDTARRHAAADAQVAFARLLGHAAIVGLVPPTEPVA